MRRARRRPRAGSCPGDRSTFPGSRTARTNRADTPADGSVRPRRACSSAPGASWRDSRRLAPETLQRLDDLLARPQAHLARLVRLDVIGDPEQDVGGEVERLREQIDGTVVPGRDVPVR